MERGRISGRFVVELAADLPAKLADGEVLGIAVDLYRPGDEEGSFQLFADGGADGWFAYLHTPRGFVRYPGSFDIRGSEIMFTVPWSSLGDLRSGRVSVLCEWSKRRAVLNQVAEDGIPQRGTAAY